MPIQIKCACGKSLQAKDEFAGKKVRCPGCSAILVAPPAEDAIAPVVRAVPPPLMFDEDDEQTAVTENPTVKVQGKSTYDADDDDDDRGYLRKKNRRRSPDRLHTSGQSGTYSVGAGVGMMVAGVVLFVGPLALGCFWPYSIILFIAGVVTVVQAALRK
jgi:hypothetical protein